MTLQQLRYLVAIADSNLNITLAAERVYATQPGISKQLKQLEEELGLRVFTRKGKSLDSITPAGQKIIERARIILREANNIKSLAADMRADVRGTINLATTHTQARFFLPETLSRFRQRYPDVSLNISQDSPADVLQRVRSGQAEFGITSTSGTAPEGLISIPIYKWRRVVVVPRDHALAGLKRPLTLQDLAKYPLVSYESSLTIDSSLTQAFRDQDLNPRYSCTARDADVIKTYVRAGLGVGIVAELGLVPEDYQDLVVLEAPAAVPACITWIVLRHNSLLRRYGRQLLEWLAPHAGSDQLERIIAGQSPAEVLNDTTPVWERAKPSNLRAA